MELALAAVPSQGRAASVQPAPSAPEAEATQALYERYAGQIFGYCLHQLGSREEAEDAVQVTFMNAFRGLRRGVVPELESAWLFKIAHNVCLSRRRSSWRRGRVESPEDFQELQDVLAAPPRGLADELVGLEGALESMPENQRRAILLREWQGLSYREIAAELELTQSAVETLIFRARRSLAQGLERPTAQGRRLRRIAKHGLDLGGFLGTAKLVFAGGTAAVAISTGALVVADDRHHLRPPSTGAAAQKAPIRAGRPIHAPVVPALLAPSPERPRPASVPPVRQQAKAPSPRPRKPAAATPPAGTPAPPGEAAPVAQPQPEPTSGQGAPRSQENRGALPKPPVGRHPGRTEDDPSGAAGSQPASPPVTEPAPIQQGGDTTNDLGGGASPNDRKLPGR